MPRLFDVVDVDKNTRTYHSALQLLEGWQVQGGLKGAKLAAYGNELIPLSPILEIALSFPGVVQAQLKAYELTIVKSILFEWDEIDPDMVPFWLGIQTAIQETTLAQIETTRYLMRLRDKAPKSILDSGEEKMHDDNPEGDAEPAKPE